MEAGGSNYARYCNEEVDALWQQALDEPDPELARPIWDDVTMAMADDPPQGGQDRIRRVLLLDERGERTTLLQLVQAAARRQGLPRVRRADLRLHPGPDGGVFLLNKGDGIVRLLVPDLP